MPSERLLDLCTKQLLAGDYHTTLEKAIETYGGIKSYFSRFRNPIGLEVEVEDAESIHIGLMSNKHVYWKADSDGSLKIYGIELISSPLSGEGIDYALLELERLFSGKSVLWSHRTSVHVHVNVSDLMIQDLHSLVGLYALFEEHFFNRVAEIRRHNPYCYPITLINPEAVKVIDDIKYCALNIGVVKKYCTVEFRHHHGTDDWKLLRRWIQICVKLVNFVERLRSSGVNKRIKEAILYGSYESLAKDIFGVSVSLFSDIYRLCEKNALWVAAYMEKNQCVDFME